MRGANGSLLGLAISADWIKGKGADLIGQRVTSHKDLATLAAVLRDPRAETFRYFLVKNGEIVYHTAVTSRMTSSSAAFVGSAGDFMNQIKATMERIGADGYYLLHNHPSGITQASEADVKLTRNVSAAIPGFLGHVILDHTEYGLIDTENPTGEAGRSFQSFKGSFPLDVTGPDPTRTGGTIPHPALGTSISSPSLFAEMANGLRDASNVVMVATDAQLRVTGIMEVPAEHMKRGKLTAFKHMARLRKVAGADYLFAITPDGMDHGDLSGNILNSGWLLDVHVSASPTSAVRGSLQDRGQMAGHRGLGRYREMFAAQPQLAYQLGLFGVMDDARREETAIAERKDSPQITLFTALDAAKIGAGETAGDPIGWDAMDIPMREELAVSAGWKTKKGSINPQGKQIVRRSWADMPQGTRDTLTRFANGDEKIGAGVAMFHTGSPVAVEPISAKDFDVVVARLTDGWNTVSRYRIVPIDDYADIPAGVLAAAEEFGYPVENIKGFVYQGHAYLVRPNLANASEGRGSPDA
ncbi:MAG: hypothetical protein IPJ52_09400 [Rhodocyclaceae bacterium]|nr:hypothetical protein [Rhodocyclaceae bacterium]